MNNYYMNPTDYMTWNRATTSSNVYTSTTLTSTTYTFPPTNNYVYYKPVTITLDLTGVKQFFPWTRAQIMNLMFAPFFEAA